MMFTYTGDSFTFLGHTLTVAGESKKIKMAGHVPCTGTGTCVHIYKLAPAAVRGPIIIIQFHGTIDECPAR